LMISTGSPSSFPDKSDMFDASSSSDVIICVKMMSCSPAGDELGCHGDEGSFPLGSGSNGMYLWHYRN
jgi:hypothetical protein